MRYLRDAAVLVGVWVIVAVRGFGGGVTFVAALITLRVLMFDWRAYRLVTRGRSWEPSKNPSDYR